MAKTEQIRPKRAGGQHVIELRRDMKIDDAQYRTGDVVAVITCGCGSNPHHLAHLINHGFAGERVTPEPEAAVDGGGGGTPPGQ